MDGSVRGSVGGSVGRSVLGPWFRGRFNLIRFSTTAFDKFSSTRLECNR